VVLLNLLSVSAGGSKGVFGGCDGVSKMRQPHAAHRYHPAAQGDRGHAVVLDPGVALGQGWNIVFENLILEPDNPECLYHHSSGTEH
jgi:hypothetical protein